jgi:hypothetical protein
MYIATLVDDITKVLTSMESARGEFTLAMLYSRSEEADYSWNLIVAARWIDAADKFETTDVFANALNLGLGLENKTTISRITTLETNDAFVRDAIFFAGRVEPPQSVPLRNLAFGGVPVGSGWIIYSRPTL